MICSLKLKKGVPILKMLLLGFVLFAFEGMPHPSHSLTSIMDNTHHGPVITLFSVQLQQLFQLRRMYPDSQPFFTVVDP